MEFFFVPYEQTVYRRENATKKIAVKSKIKFC